MSAVILDTETTGIDEPQPVEIAWLRVDSPADLKVGQMFCCRYKPSKPIALASRR